MYEDGDGWFVFGGADPVVRFDVGRFGYILKYWKQQELADQFRSSNQSTSQSVLTLKSSLLAPDMIPSSTVLVTPATAFARSS